MFLFIYEETGVEGLMVYLRLLVRGRIEFLRLFFCVFFLLRFVCIRRFFCRSSFFVLVLWVVYDNVSSVSKF